MKSSSGVQELFNILTFLRSINKIPKRAVAEIPLWLNKNKELNYNCGITSLSPSDYSIYLSNFKIAELVPQIKTEKRRLLSITPNHAAVVLWIRINDIVILLGSDLEVSTEEKSGWVAILNSKTRPDGKADFFKIPHHGSENSDHLRIWDEMVSDNAVVALTPFQNGKTSLPKGSDVERICSNRKECYITATARKKRIKTDRSVDKIIDRGGGIRSRKLVHSDFGQVRLRSVFSTRSFKWNIDLIGGASRLQFTANSR